MASSAPVAHIPWNTKLEELLFSCVITKGAHIAPMKRITQTWTEVHEMFFNQPELQECKALCYKEGVFRKIRVKYQNVMTAVQADIDKGNQSGKEGELSQLYQYVKQINEEIAEKEAAKEAEVELKAKLSETEKTILTKAGSLKRKQLDGKIIDNTQSDRAVPLSFDDKLLMLAAGTGSQEDKKRKMNADEDRFEATFLKWIEHSKKTLAGLLTDSEVSLRHHDDVEDIGLKTLVSIYCTRDSSFSAVAFKRELREMELPMVVCSKIYMGLQEWRRDFEQSLPFGMLDNASTVTTSSSSSTDGGSTMSSLGMGSPAPTY
jgi:hypothetical protein